MDELLGPDSFNSCLKEYIKMRLSNIQQRKHTEHQILWNRRKASTIPLFHKVQLLDGSLVSLANSYLRASAG